MGAHTAILSSYRCPTMRVRSRSKTLVHVLGLGSRKLACDQPALRADYLRALIEEPQRVTGSAYAESIGVPAYFPAEFFSSLLQLRGDTGARALLKTAYAIGAEGLTLDIDTEQDLDVARSMLEMRRSED